MRGLGFPDWQAFDAEKSLGWIVSGVAFLFPLTVLSVNRADSALLLLLGAIGVYAFLRHGVRGLALDRRALILMGLFAAWYAVIVLCYFAGDRSHDGFKLLGRYLRLLFFIPVFIACRRYLIRPSWLFAGLALAPFPVLGLALWQVLDKSGSVRATGFVEPISFGDLSMAMAFMALVFLGTVGRPHRGRWYLLAAAALTAGIMASVLSGTRGGWIAVPVLMGISVLALAENSRRRAMNILAVCCALVVLAILLTPGMIIRDRARQAMHDLASYRIYLQLLDTKDVARLGCFNQKLFLENLVQRIRMEHIQNLDIEVVDDASRLRRDGFSTSCESGYVIRASNTSSQENLTFRFARNASPPFGLQTVQVIARGEGKFTLLYEDRGNPAWTGLYSAGYRDVTHSGMIVSLSWLDFRLLAGETLYFVPVQRSVGEYVYPMVSSSVGERLEMWRTAWHIFKQFPLLGAGTGSFMHEVGEHVSVGEIAPAIRTYDHPHNDYLNAMVSWGLLGLAVWLLVMGYPLILFKKALHSASLETKAAGFAGLLMVLGLLIFGLTETMFTHSIVISWYVTFTAMLTAIMLGPTRKADGKENGRQHDDGI